MDNKRPICSRFSGEMAHWYPFIRYIRPYGKYHKDLRVLVFKLFEMQTKMDKLEQFRVAYAQVGLRDQCF